MIDIFKFIFIPNKENREKIFEKNISEKRKISFYLILLSIINYFLPFLLILLERYLSNTSCSGFLSFCYNIYNLLIVFIGSITIFSIIYIFLHIILKIFGSNKNLIDTLLILSIPMMFLSISFFISIFLIYILIFILPILFLLFIPYTIFLLLNLINGIIKNIFKSILIIILLFFSSLIFSELLFTFLTFFENIFLNMNLNNENKFELKNF